METDRTIAYFSMEIALEVGMPTYSGGLGVLAGDTVRAAADIHIPMVAVTLLHRQGYFYQRLDNRGGQHEEPAAWAINDFVHAMPERTSVTVEGRTVHLRAWSARQRRLGSHIDRCPVRWRCPLPAVPGSAARDRRGAYATGARLYSHRPLSYE